MKHTHTITTDEASGAGGGLPGGLILVGVGVALLAAGWVIQAVQAASADRAYAAASKATAEARLLEAQGGQAGTSGWVYVALVVLAVAVVGLAGLQVWSARKLRTIAEFPPTSQRRLADGTVEVLDVTSNVVPIGGRVRGELPSLSEAARMRHPSRKRIR